jgi:hypothetical protein
LKAPIIIALAVITVGGIACIAYMMGNNNSNKVMEPSANNNSGNNSANRNNRVIDATAEFITNPVSSMTPVANSFQQWISTQPDRYQDHIRSLDNDTRQWLMGMEPEDRISYLRRAVSRDVSVGTGIGGNSERFT